jgi:flavin-dependent dehydrogenase
LAFSIDEPPTTSWDVIVIGGGPAGSATAMTLARLGQRVLLVDDQGRAKFKLGESLPPPCVGLLKQFLGKIERADEGPCGMFRAAGNVSVWATEQAQTTDFFFTLTGFGLCVDRIAFDEALRSKAESTGVAVLRGVRFESCTQLIDTEANWRLRFGQGVPEHHARYLVDCSGRRAVVAHALGSSVHETSDQLFAYAQWFATSDLDEDPYTRIEAGPHGWWYTNRLPGVSEGATRRVVVFHSDRDLPQAKSAASPDGFQQLLGDSVHIGPMLEDRGYRPFGSIRGAPANSQRLTCFCGNAWMAVGDAAQAYDPLSSQGIDKALRSGSHAGHLIHYALSDGPVNAEALSQDNHYIRQYVLQQQQLWQDYESQRDFYYRTQPRWEEQPFWQRRRY